MKAVSMFAVAISLLVAQAGSAMAADCATEVARVKTTIQTSASSPKVQSGKAVAEAKLKDAEAALAKKDENGCAAAIAAADAAIK